MTGYKDYHAAGFPVIGIYPMDHDRKCTCERPECDAAGKHPIMSNWQCGIIWEDDQLENMREFGQLNSFGVLVDGYLVVDVDQSHVRVCSQRKIYVDAARTRAGSRRGSHVKHVFHAVDIDFQRGKHG